MLIIPLKSVKVSYYHVITHLAFIERLETQQSIWAGNRVCLSNFEWREENDEALRPPILRELFD